MTGGRHTMIPSGVQADELSFRDAPPCAAEVVYLFGILPRSGTNMLADILEMHPEITAPEIPGVPEVLLTANADALLDFVARVRASWENLASDPDPSLDELVARSAWAGIERYFLRRDLTAAGGGEPSPVRYRLIRSPTIQNLDLFPQLTSSKAIVIVRDGRAVLESGMRSFGWSFERYLHQWTAAAELVRRVTDESDQILTVKYEDVLADRRAEVARMLEFLDLDHARYPFENAPMVRGSSALFDGGVFWEGVPAPEDFDPLHRWSGWSRSRHRRFNAVAGDEMELLGYPIARESGPAVAASNALLDLAWPVRNSARLIARRVLPREVKAKLLWQRGKRYRRGVS